MSDLPEAAVAAGADALTAWDGRTPKLDQMKASAVLRAASVEEECPLHGRDEGGPETNYNRDGSVAFISGPCDFCGGSGSVWVLRTAPGGS